MISFYFSVNKDDQGLSKRSNSYITCLPHSRAQLCVDTYNKRRWIGKGPRLPAQKGIPVGEMGFPDGTSGKELPASTGEIRDADSIPGSGRSPGGKHGNPLQYVCLENCMDRRAGGLQSKESQRVRHNRGNLARYRGRTSGPENNAIEADAKSSSLLQRPDGG